MQQTLTAANVALILQTHPNRVRELARTGTLKGVRIGKSWRFTQKDVEAFLEAGRPAPPHPQETTP